VHPLLPLIVHKDGLLVTCVSLTPPLSFLLCTQVQHAAQISSLTAFKVRVESCTVSMCRPFQQVTDSFYVTMLALFVMSPERSAVDVEHPRIPCHRAHG
jgi:hypothetical protein